MRRKNPLGYNDWPWEGENKSQNKRISDYSDSQIQVILREKQKLWERTWLLVNDILAFN